MGIYVQHQVLMDQLVAMPPPICRDSADIIPISSRMAKRLPIASPNPCVECRERGHWRDVGTVDAYWEANIDLTDVTRLDLYDRDWPIWTYAELKPPAKFVHDEDGRRGSAVSSLVSGDCIVSGASLKRSLIFTGARINSYSTLEEVVMLPDVHVGRNAKLKRVVIDHGVGIPEGLVVGEDPVLDARSASAFPKGVCLVTGHDRQAGALEQFRKSVKRFSVKSTSRQNSGTDRIRIVGACRFCRSRQEFFR
jgi:glucose-1-phosphate adenylyltransferase